MTLLLQIVPERGDELLGSQNEIALPIAVDGNIVRELIDGGKHTGVSLTNTVHANVTPCVDGAKQRDELALFDVDGVLDRPADHGKTNPKFPTAYLSPCLKRLLDKLRHEDLRARMRR